jgi:hypothetical protein
MVDKELSFSELAKQCLEDSEEWFGDLDVVYSIPYYTLCLAESSKHCFANSLKLNSLSTIIIAYLYRNFKCAIIRVQ